MGIFKKLKEKRTNEIMEKVHEAAEKFKEELKQKPSTSFDENSDDFWEKWGDFKRELIKITKGRFSEKISKSIINKSLDFVDDKFFEFSSYRNALIKTLIKKNITEENITEENITKENITKENYSQKIEEQIKPILDAIELKIKETISIDKKKLKSDVNARAKEAEDKLEEAKKLYSEMEKLYETMEKKQPVIKTVTEEVSDHSKIVLALCKEIEKNKRKEELSKITSNLAIAKKYIYKAKDAKKNMAIETRSVKKLDDSIENKFSKICSISDFILDYGSKKIQPQRKEIFKKSYEIEENVYKLRHECDNRVEKSLEVFRKAREDYESALNILKEHPELEQEYKADQRKIDIKGVMVSEKAQAAANNGNIKNIRRISIRESYSGRKKYDYYFCESEMNNIKKAWNDCNKTLEKSNRNDWFFDDYEMSSSSSHNMLGTEVKKYIKSIGKSKRIFRAKDGEPEKKALNKLHHKLGGTMRNMKFVQYDVNKAKDWDTEGKFAELLEEIQSGKKKIKFGDKEIKLQHIKAKSELSRFLYCCRFPRPKEPSKAKE